MKDEREFKGNRPLNEESRESVRALVPFVAFFILPISSFILLFYDAPA